MGWTGTWPPTPRPPLLERSRFFRPDPSGLAFHTMTLWQVGVGTRGPIPRKSQSPWHAPVTPSGQLLRQWVPPRQTLPASSPCSGHQLYLPEQGNALAPQPSTICPPRLLRGQPNLGHPLPSPQLLQRRQAQAVLWERLDAALHPRPALLPRSRTQALTTPDRLISHHKQGGGDPPL